MEDKQGKSENDVCEDPNDDSPDPPRNKGKFIIDATCAPADIGYPTDLKILNKAREKKEEIIDTLHKPFKGHQRKPHTYRQTARKEFLAVAKARKLTRRKQRKAIRKQLSYLKRNPGKHWRIIQSELIAFAQPPAI